MGKLIIKRDKGWVDSARKYKVICNDVILGTLSNGESKEFSTNDTKIVLYFKIDWCRSNKLEMNLNQDQLKYIKCGSSLRGFRMFLGFFYAILMPHKYLWAKEIDEKEGVV